MSKTIAPLLSFGASGQIAKTQVYAAWKGRNYVRRYVVPANPNTVAQQDTRNAFRYLTDLFRFLPADALAAWALYAKSSRFTAVNGFIKKNLAPIRTAADNNDLVLSVGANGGFSPAGVSLTGGALKITVAMTAATLPAGWTVDSALAACAVTQNSPWIEPSNIFFSADSSDPYSFDITGLAATTEYVVSAWFRYTKPDGSLAYGPPSVGLETTS